MSQRMVNPTPGPLVVVEEDAEAGLVARQARRDQGHRFGHRRPVHAHRSQLPAGYEAPLHVHYREDEGWFLILDGSASLQVGDATLDMNAGDYAFGPAQRTAPLHGRRGWVPDAVSLHTRRLRDARARAERARRRPDSAAAVRRAAGP